jgi:sec-independent protein translocase protein TatA
MFANLGTVEIVIIAVVIFVLFGGKKLPEFARGISNAAKEFNKGLHSSNEKPEEKTKK